MDLGRAFHDHYHSYGLLNWSDERKKRSDCCCAAGRGQNPAKARVDSFEAQAAKAVASRNAPDDRLRPSPRRERANQRSDVTLHAV